MSKKPGPPPPSLPRTIGPHSAFRRAATAIRELREAGGDIGYGGGGLRVWGPAPLARAARPWAEYWNTIETMPIRLPPAAAIEYCRALWPRLSAAGWTAAEVWAAPIRPDMRGLVGVWSPAWGAPAVAMVYPNAVRAGASHDLLYVRAPELALAPPRWWDWAL